MTGSAIRHLASSWSGKFLAAAEFKSAVSVWSLETLKKLAQFDTILDFGGHRLAIGADGSRCVAGAYQVHGIACYDAQSGEKIWQRKDLKKVQTISISPGQSEVVCGFADGPLQILRIRDGKTLQKIRGCSDLQISPLEPVQMVDKAKPQLQTLDASTFARIERESFAILSVAFGHGAVAISEATGPVRCFETTTGRNLWRYKGPPGTHALELGYHFQLRRFLAVERPYEKGGIKTLLLLDAQTGKVEAKRPLDESATETFCSAGARLVSSDGWMIDSATGRLVGQFDFPLREYPDNRG